MSRLATAGVNRIGTATPSEDVALLRRARAMPQRLDASSAESNGESPPPLVAA